MTGDSFLSRDFGVSDLDLPDRPLGRASCRRLGEAVSSLDDDLDEILLGDRDFRLGDFDFPPDDLDLSAGLRDW